MSKMGLIKSVKSLANHKNISLNEELYNQIDKWKALYSGYYEKWHKVKFSTLGGNKERTMATLNMPKVISQELATLIFNERCEINISDEPLKVFVNEVLKQNKFVKNFQDYLEYKFALGGMVIKPYVVNNKLKLSYVTADCFIPISWDNESIKEGVFINEFTKGDKKYTHLEWHLWDGDAYIIRNELYESTNGTELGFKVHLNTLYPDLKEEVRITQYKRSGFVYFKPNTANNIDMTSPLGVSVYANSLDTLKSLDIAFDSYQREFKLGKKKIIVPSNSLKAVLDPETGVMHKYYDPDDEIYEAFNYDDENAGVQDISVTLRVQEHIDAINAYLNILAMQIGFSAGTFTFDGQGIKTATEVVSENSKTFRTKQSHENVIEAGLQELIECIVQTAALYDLLEAPKDYEVTVAFDDSIAEDQTAEINRQILLITNKLQTRKKAIAKIYGYTDEEAEQLVKEILEENKTIAPENVDFFGVGDE